MSTRWLDRLIFRLRSLLKRTRVERELDAELRFHVGRQIEENLAAGMGDGEARAAALRMAGNIAHIKERCRDSMGVALIDECRQDILYARRTLFRTPGFTAVASLTLALGIGAATAIFAVVNGVLIRPLAYPEPDALVRIVHSIGGVDQPYFSDAIFVHYVSNTRAFQDLGVWSPGQTAAITGQDDPEEVPALMASRGVLTTLGVRPEIGRWFSTVEDAPGAPDTVILSRGYWQRRFGGDPRALQQTLTVNGRPHQIIGVMPPGFAFGGAFEIVLPLRINTASPLEAFRFVGVARLKTGVTLASANADVDRLLDSWFAKEGRNPAIRARWRPALVPLKQDVIGDVGRTLWVLMGAIGVVLLMACGNVANLLMVRGDARRHELAIRGALGASPARLARQLLIESLTVAVLGGALGVALAYAGLRILVAIGPSNIPRLSELSIDVAVLGFSLAISLASGLLFGMIPIGKHLGRQLMTAIGAGRSASLSRERQRSHQVLVVAQIALALVLLVSAGLMIRSFQALRHVDPGFTQPERVQTFSISIPVTMVPERERVVRMQHQLLEAIDALPGVTSVAFTTRLPMAGERYSTAIAVEGRGDDGRTPPNHQVKVISPGTFQTFGTSLVAGRDFTWTDIDERRGVAIVSENLARELWGSPDAALGRRFREYYVAKAPWWEIVGVVGDVHDDGVDRRPPATVYFPAQPHEQLLGIAGYQARRVNVVLRSERVGTASLLNEVGHAVRSVSASLPLAQPRTLDEVYARSMARTSFTLVMLAIAGTMALLLGISGIYGVISYAVSHRRREIGIRMALGAQAADIRQLFMRRGLVLAAVGLTIGLGSAAGSTRLMQSLLFGISPLDSLTFTAMPVVLGVAAALASYLPARRAMAVDPAETLRAE